MPKKTTVSIIECDVGVALRRMGEYEPSKLPAEALEYTTLPQVLEKLKCRFTKVKPFFSAILHCAVP